MLSASRKYKLYLTIAEQSAAQQEQQRLTEAILANVGTIICFGLGSPADARLLEDRFEPWLDRHELLNQPMYSFYLRVKAEEPIEPVSGETIVLARSLANEKIASALIEASRTNNAIEWSQRDSVRPTAKELFAKTEDEDGEGSDPTAQAEALEA